MAKSFRDRRPELTLGASRTAVAGAEVKGGAFRHEKWAGPEAAPTLEFGAGRGDTVSAEGPHPAVARTEPAHAPATLDDKQPHGKLAHGSTTITPGHRPDRGNAHAHAHARRRRPTHTPTPTPHAHAGAQRRTLTPDAHAPEARPYVRLVPISRRTSFSISRALIASRLSCDFRPRARPISNFTRPPLK